MSITPRILSDELASRRGRKAEKIADKPAEAIRLSHVPSGAISDMIRLGPGAIGTSGAFQFGVPDTGIIKLRILGAGQVANLQFAENGDVYALNNAVALTTGAMFEFEFAVDNGETLFVSGTSLAKVTCFWRPY